MNFSKSYASTSLNESEASINESPEVFRIPERILTEFELVLTSRKAV